MMTSTKREELGKNLLSLELLLEKKGLGYDCEGEIIKAGDNVIVEVEESLRDNDPEYKFCGKGKKGVLVGQKNLSDFIHWFVDVKFIKGNNESCVVVCVDYHLKKI